ncbi:MAG: hypothetical protein ACD_54C00215G0009 [uncultured bacterium]|nr:MAG: hypothetical protein ACD_54C00215G0009 [uncultured bacterium]
MAVPVGLDLAQLLKGGIERIPNLRGQCGADDAAIFTGIGDAGRHRVRIVAVKEQIAFDLRLRRCTVFRGVAIGIAAGAQQAVPIVAVAVRSWQQRDPRPHFQQARSGFGALHVAGDPVKVVGGP